jgi:hypothetical protein
MRRVTLSQLGKVNDHCLRRLWPRLKRRALTNNGAFGTELAGSDTLAMR